MNSTEEPRIIRPFFINRNRYVEIEGRTRVAVEGRYTIRAIKPGHGIVRELSFPNVLTNIGLDALGDGVSFTRMHLGTGTTPPAVTDTALASFGVNVSTTTPSMGADMRGVSGSAPHYGWGRLSWTSAVGGATGTWREIGVSNQNTNGNLRSRALILDSGGSPTDFPVKSDEQFQGFYEFRIYAPASDAPEAVSMSGIPYDTVTRAIRVTSASTGGGWTPDQLSTGSWLFSQVSSSSTRQDVWSGGLSAETASTPLGTRIVGNGAITVASYGSGNHYRDMGMRFGAGSSGALKTFMVQTHGGSFQTEYDPVINKLTTEEVIHNLRIGWARR